MAINQAVIVAGGQGQRLMPLTKSVPKPLIDINGHPFIWHLISRLREQNVKEIFILSGYKSEMFDQFLA